MAQEYKFKTVLSTLKKGERPCYRAVVVSNGSIDAEQLYQEAAQGVGLKTETVRYVAQLLFGALVDYAKEGKYVTISNFLGTSLSIRGVFDSADGQFEKGRHVLRLNINPKGDLAKACRGGVCVNVTSGNRCRISSVMDSVTKQDGVIAGEEDVEVYAAGSTFLIDPNAEDEGCWIENAQGEVVVFGEVTASTATTLDVTFATLPEPGDNYKFVVATRGGMGKDYGVSIARRNVTIRAAE